MRSLARLIAGFVVSLALVVPAFGLETFPDEVKARQHCPRDVVVWLNLPTMIWHWKGQRWYANTKHGAYACEKEQVRQGRGGRGMGSEYERHLVFDGLDACIRLLG